MSIASNDNSDNTLAIFEVTDVTDSSGYLTVDVQNGTGTMPSDTEQCVLNFSRTGDKGEKGLKGDKGDKGDKGIKGDKGQKGEFYIEG